MAGCSHIPQQPGGRLSDAARSLVAAPVCMLFRNVVRAAISDCARATWFRCARCPLCLPNIAALSVSVRPNKEMRIEKVMTV